MFENFFFINQLSIFQFFNFQVKLTGKYPCQNRMIIVSFLKFQENFITIKIMIFLSTFFKLFLIENKYVLQKIIRKI